MTPYIIGWLLMYVSLALWTMSKYKGSALIVTTLSYLVFLCFLRGQTGTDTVTYEHLLRELLLSRNVNGLEQYHEQAFWMPLVLAAGHLESEMIAVRVIGILFYSMIGIFLYSSTKNEKFLLLAYILPVFAFQYSMNGLRLGLASALLLLIVQQLPKGSRLWQKLLLFIPALLQVTTVLSTLLILVAGSRWSAKTVIATIAAVIVAGFALSVGPNAYLEQKFNMYQDYHSPGAWSGLSKVAIVAILLAGISMGVLPSVAKARIISVALLLTIFALGIAFYSYAGLRLLDLLTFALPTAVLVNYKSYGLDFCKNYRYALIIAGLLGSAGVARNMLLEGPDANSPFIPYKTFLTERQGL